MTEPKLLRFPPDHRNPAWWKDTNVLVRWEVERECASPLITGVGTIAVLREEPTEEDDDYQEVGRIVITKAPLGHYDIVEQMDALSSDHEQLASQIFDGSDYDMEFVHWLLDELGLELVGEAVFVLDLVINEHYNDIDCAVAAHAALDALMTFGNSQSPLITFHRTGVAEELRESLDGVGLWAWVHALRAKKWKQTYVAVCGW